MKRMSATTTRVLRIALHETREHTPCSFSDNAVRACMRCHRPCMTGPIPYFHILRPRCQLSQHCPHLQHVRLALWLNARLRYKVDLRSYGVKRHPYVLRDAHMVRNEVYSTLVCTTLDRGSLSARLIRLGAIDSGVEKNGISCSAQS